MHMNCTVCGKAMWVKLITYQIEQIRTDADILRKSSTYIPSTFHKNGSRRFHENENAQKNKSNTIFGGVLRI